jgi:hypothetical protein
VAAGAADWGRLRPGREAEHDPGAQATASGFAEMGELSLLLMALGFTLDRRPWLVEAERQGPDGAPHRLWRVIGWRRSARWARQVARAIERGQLDLVPDRPG